MRRANLARLPALMHYYPGLRPWDLPRLTPLELDELWTWLIQQQED